MVTISSTTNSVIFTFDDNSHYLQNGTIEVPKNALALVVDDSDMVTFKKASSNDIFLSITLAELDMTKEEVISYYQANMVGAEGITSGEVQTMIDESISGKADSSTVETLSGTVTAHTSDTTIHVTSADKTAWDAKQNALSAGTNISIVNDVISASVPDVSVYFDDAKYEMSGQTHVINFYNGNVIKATINADDFIKDGMVDSVAIENGYLVITFNTDSGKQPISIPLTDIFDPSNYYTTAQTDSAIASAVSGKADNSTVETLSGTVTAHTADTTVHVTSSDKQTWNAKLDSSALAPYYTSAQTDSAITQATSGKADSSTVETLSGQVTANTASISNKADTSALTEYWTSAQTNSAITQATSGKADSSTVQTLSGQVIDDELVIVNGFLNVNAQLATKANASDLGGVKIVALSQQAYDALAPNYDANTLYIINS